MFSTFKSDLQEFSDSMQRIACFVREKDFPSHKTVGIRLSVSLPVTPLLTIFIVLIVLQTGCCAFFVDPILLRSKVAK